MDNNIVKKSKNIFIYLISFVSSAVGILLNFFLARILEAEIYGKIQYFVALATTCSQFMILGLNTFLIREAKNEKQNGDVLNKCLSLYFAIVIFAFPIIWFVLSNYIANTKSNHYLTLIVIIMAILMGVNALVSSFFQGSGKYQLKVFFENLLPKATMFILALVFMLLGKINNFANNYLLFYIGIYSLVAIPLLFIFYKKIIFSFTKSELMTIAFFFGITLTYSLGNNLTIILQEGLYKNEIALAIISVSISIVSLVKVISAVLDNMIKPIFAKKKRENDIDGLLGAYRFDTRVNSYVSVPLYIFFILHSSKFLALFGESYTQYPLILMFIALVNAVTDVTGPNGTMLAMTGKEKWELLNGIIYFAVYISFVFVFSFDKIYGLCISLLLAEIAVNVVKFIEVWLIYKRPPLDIKTLFTILLEVTFDFGIIFTLRFLTVSLWLWMIIGILVGVLLVIINTFVLSFYRKKDFSTLLELRI